jgi:flagellar motility protein MotE (MotC chaperone)
MMNIKKRSEKQEAFDRKKIENSIRNAGADEKTAGVIAKGVSHRDGLKTSEVRKHVVEHLSKKDAKLGKSYETFKKPAAAVKK